MLIKFPFGLSLKEKQLLVEVLLRFIIFSIEIEKFKVKVENNLINPSKLKEIQEFPFPCKTPQTPRVKNIQIKKGFYPTKCFLPPCFFFKF